MYRLIVVLSFLALGVTLGITLALVAPESPGQPIEWLDNPRSIDSFKLHAESGDFNHQSLQGQWDIVVFGFLHCPDICPTSLSQLATLADQLSASSMDGRFSFVFVSVDPGRDTVAEVSQYARHFHPSILGVTGTSEQLMRFAGDLGVRFTVAAGNDDYTVAHSATYSIIDPQGTLRGRFRPGFDASALVQNMTTRLTEATL